MMSSLTDDVITSVAVGLQLTLITLSTVIGRSIPTDSVIGQFMALRL